MGYNMYMTGLDTWRKFIQLDPKQQVMFVRHLEQLGGAGGESEDLLLLAEILEYEDLCELDANRHLISLLDLTYPAWLANLEYLY